LIDLIPHEYLWLAFIVGIILLIKGASLFVDGASEIAESFGLSKLVVGLTVVAIGTSGPEFAVSSYAAYQGAGELALANVVGSNIFNLGFILAICAMASPIAIEKRTVFRDCSFLLFGASLLAGFVLFDSIVSRVEGFILCLLILGYITFLIISSNQTKDEENHEKRSRQKLSWRQVGGVLVGLAALLLGCNLVVDSAKIFATELGISEWLIGITVIAIGTSLPELVTAIASVVKGNTELGVGGLIGSDIFNIFGVIGSTAMLAPMTVGPGSRIPFLFLVLTIIVTAIFMRTNWRLSRAEGLMLFIIASLRYGFEVVGAG